MGRVVRTAAGWTLAAVVAALTGLAQAEETAEAPECFDALVQARMLRQVPTPFPDCGDDCIVMSWPWIIELDVERVLSGAAPPGRLTVLTVQHTEYIAGRGASRWWLRRNDLGGFNVLRLGDEALPARCAKGAPAAHPYIRPAPGQNLGDLVKDGERVYGSGSEAK